MLETPPETLSTAPSGDRKANAKAWLRALERTSVISGQAYRTFFDVIREISEADGNRLALISDRQQLSYRDLVNRSNKYAQWALEEGLAKGSTAALLMPNCPEYPAIWLGITQTGAAVALLNTNLKEQSLAQCVNTVRPDVIIVDAALVGQLVTAFPHLSCAIPVRIFGRSGESSPGTELNVDVYPAEPITPLTRPTIDDRALYIYTSGTTGLPKAAIVTHGRIMQWTQWFAGLMDIQKEDRIYNCLPMYHSVGGVQATGAVLAGGGAVVIREKFSATRFWEEIVHYDCTLFQYIGELCRYLLNTPASSYETAHRIRLACGNGLTRDIWEKFRSRFRIPRLLEFYAATEGNVSFFNVEEQPGSVGRIPAYLAHRFNVALAKFDFDTTAPVRNEQNFCIPCGPNEIGEALGAIPADGSGFGARFEGYSSGPESEQKVLCDVFTRGDKWFRTGDLMRRDEKGFFYFVDRIGDTFRWKGENVSTSEISGVLCRFPGVLEAGVYGVTIPGTDGRAGMAMLHADEAIDLAELRAYLDRQLPAYARPVFLRFGNSIGATSTFKQVTQRLRQEGYDPRAVSDPLYFDHPANGAYIRLDAELYKQIASGSIDFSGCGKHSAAS